MQDNPLYDEALIAELLRLRREDPDKLMDLVLGVMKQYPDLVVEDESDPQKKLKALTAMLEHYEEKEEYENCADIRDLTKKIKSEGK